MTWQHRAACNSAPPVLFFPGGEGNDIAEALAYCRECPVLTDCAAHAARYGCSGIWGGVLLDAGHDDGTPVLEQIAAGVQDQLRCQTCWRLIRPVGSLREDYPATVLATSDATHCRVCVPTCVNGHRRTPQNTRPGNKGCKDCDAESAARRRQVRGVA